jgi:ethanolamine utilization protein EutA
LGSSVSTFAQGIVRGMAGTITRSKPLYIMLDGDIAQTLGAILREELDVTSEILAIDGVVLWDFDYIDLGRIRLPSMTVPVTIKSLVFSEDPRLPRGTPHLHDHEHPHDHGHDHDHHHGHGHHEHRHG